MRLWRPHARASIALATLWKITADTHDRVSAYLASV